MNIEDIRLKPEELYRITGGYDDTDIETANAATNKAVIKVAKDIENIISNPQRVNYRLSEISEYLESLKEMVEGG